MHQKYLCLVLLVASSDILLECTPTSAKDLWTRTKETVSTTGSKVGEAIGGFKEQSTEWDPSNKDSDFRQWFAGRDPGMRVNKEAERTGRKFGEGLIEGAKPGIDLLIDDAGKKALEVSQRVNADVLATGTKLIDDTEAAARKLLTEGEDAANRIVIKTFDRADETIVNAEKKASSIIKEAMNRQAEIVDNSLTRIENLSDNALTRIEYLQADTMGRFEAAISDQVPFTASDVFAQAEVFILLMTVACFLFGAIVFYLKEDGAFKRTMKEPFTWKSIWGRSIEALSIGSRVLLRFGPPLAFSALMVHMLYMWHYSTSRSSRFETLIAAAEDAESAGDFRTAAAFRLRLCRLSPKQKYMYEFKRDTFLAKYYQGHKKLSDSEIDSSIIGLIEADPHNEYLGTDLESLCLICYEASKAPILLRQGFVDLAMGIKPETPTQTSYAEFIKIVKSRLLKMKEDGKRLPFGGKFVFIALMKQALGPSDGRRVEDRLKAAEEIASQLVVCYPKYPAGLQAASIIGSTRLVSIEWLPKEEQIVDNAIRKELDSLNYFSSVATAIDPLFSELVALESEVAPPDVVDRFDNTQKTIKPDNDEQARKSIEELKNDEYLTDYIANLNFKASNIYGNGVLARLFAEQCASDAIIRGRNIKEMISKIKDARDLLVNDDIGRVEQYKACLNASELAVKAGQLYVAERWLSKAAGIDLQGADNRNTELEDKIHKNLQGDLARVVCRLLD